MVFSRASHSGKTKLDHLRRKGFRFSSASLSQGPRGCHRGGREAIGDRSASRGPHVGKPAPQQRFLAPSTQAVRSRSPLRNSFPSKPRSRPRSEEIPVPGRFYGGNSVIFLLQEKGEIGSIWAQRRLNGFTGTLFKGPSCVHGCCSRRLFALASSPPRSV